MNIIQVIELLPLLFIFSAVVFLGHMLANVVYDKQNNKEYRWGENIRSSLSQAGALGLIILFTLIVYTFIH